jgi:hypothetical protein
MGYIFTNAAKKVDDAQTVIAIIRDKIKSVLRGVSDFTKYPDVVDDHGNHLSWYPNPAQPKGNQAFNVFNLDPFVWFVHVQLGFSGYGFSVDDDTADVGAGGATQLQLTVTGTGGLKNTNAWSIQAPYGPVKNISCTYSGPASATNGDTLYNAISGVSNTTPIRITTPVQHHLSNGDTVIIDQVAGDPAANGTFKIGNVTKTTFDLFDATTGTVPVAPSGSYVSGGRWSYPLHAYIDSGADLTKVFYRVTGDDALGTFLGTLVSVKGVDRNKKTGEKFRIWQRGRQDVGRLLLGGDLTDASGNPLPAGTYNFTFFGIAEAKATPAPTPPTPEPSNAAYLVRLRNQLSNAKNIDDPTRRQRVLGQLRDWIKIVQRGVDPDSQRGKILHRLVIARHIPNPDLRERRVNHLLDELHNLNGE